MGDTDDVMQGFVIGAFILFGISAFCCCFRFRSKTTATLKQSPSMEELQNAVSEDPSV